MYKNLSEWRVSSFFNQTYTRRKLTPVTMYPDTFEGFQVDSAETWTSFHKREVSD